MEKAKEEEAKGTEDHPFPFTRLLSFSTPAGEQLTTAPSKRRCCCWAAVLRRLKYRLRRCCSETAGEDQLFEKGEEKVTMTSHVARYTSHAALCTQLHKIHRTQSTKIEALEKSPPLFPFQRTRNHNYIEILEITR